MRVFIAIVAVALAGSLLASAQDLTSVELLGKNLFFDKISSPSKSMSCATCHAPAAGWTGAIAGINRHGAVYRGADPKRFGNRKPPTTAYAAQSPVFHLDPTEGVFVGGVFWDGCATGEQLGSPVAEQALGPFLNPVEQNNASATDVCEAVARSGYADLFEEVWGPDALDCSPEGIAATYELIGLSIGAYEASSEVNPFSSRFDEYWIECIAAGNSPEVCGKAEDDQVLLDPLGILSEQEFSGLIEFGEYCSACHISFEYGPGGTPPLFTDYTFDNIGVPINPENPFYDMDEVFLDDGTSINPLGDAWVDFGLGDFLRTRPEWAPMAFENDGKQKVPTVRNVAAVPGKGFPKAFMHNGVFKTLEEVVHFYNTRDVPEENWPPPEVDRNVNREILEGVPLGNLELDQEAEDAIVAFLKTLTDIRPPGPPIRESDRSAQPVDGDMIQSIR